MAARMMIAAAAVRGERSEGRPRAHLSDRYRAAEELCGGALLADARQRREDRRRIAARHQAWALFGWEYSLARIEFIGAESCMPHPTSILPGPEDDVVGWSCQVL